MHPIHSVTVFEVVAPYTLRVGFEDATSRLRGGRRRALDPGPSAGAARSPLDHPRLLAGAGREFAFRLVHR